MKMNEFENLKRKPLKNLISILICFLIAVSITAWMQADNSRSYELELPARITAYEAMGYIANQYHSRTGDATYFVETQEPRALKEDEVLTYMRLKVGDRAEEYILHHDGPFLIKIYRRINPN